MLPFCCVCTYSMVCSPTITYILYGRTMITVQQIIIIFAILLLFLLLLAIVIYNCAGYVQQNNNNALVYWSMINDAHVCRKQCIMYCLLRCYCCCSCCLSAGTTFEQYTVPKQISHNNKQDIPSSSLLCVPVLVLGATENKLGATMFVDAVYAWLINSCPQIHLLSAFDYIFFLLNSRL